MSKPLIGFKISSLQVSIDDRALALSIQDTMNREITKVAQRIPCSTHGLQTKIRAVQQEDRSVTITGACCEDYLKKILAAIE